MIRYAFSIGPAVLLVILCIAPAAAQDLEEAVRSFDEGNLRYREGDYRGAVDHYSHAVEAGYVSGALLFNMGNAYFRLDEIGQAIRYYEKAAKLTPEITELGHNLAIARARTVDQFSRLPEPFWETWWQWTMRTFGSRALFAVGVIFYLCAAITLGLRIRNGQTPWRRRILTVSAALAVLFISTGYAASVDADRLRHAVVVTDEVGLRENPEGARTDLSVHEGLVVEIVTDESNWTEIRLPNGVRGWVRAESLGRI